uniref:Integrase catalytic domain-containing protein n=1 Tax=Amphimedon queenslandica TaxID=400682 RepID=A0A1X7UBC4_AMPQE
MIYCTTVVGSHYGCVPLAKRRRRSSLLAVAVLLDTSLGCLTCASFDRAGRRMKPPLMPIPAVRPFYRVGVDIMELPLTVHGNKYVTVFMDYLTKWVEAFPAADETSEAIAILLANEIIFPHEVPKKLSSD